MTAPVTKPSTDSTQIDLDLLSVFSLSWAFTYVRTYARHVHAASSRTREMSLSPRLRYLPTRDSNVSENGLTNWTELCLRIADCTYLDKPHLVSTSSPPHPSRQHDERKQCTIPPCHVTSCRRLSSRPTIVHSPLPPYA